MKKILPLFFIILALTFAGCTNRLHEDKSTSPDTSESSSSDDSSVIGDAELSDPETDLSDISPEQESEAISIVVDLISQANICNDIYRGNLKINTSAPSQQLGEDEYYPLDSEFTSVEAIENFWNNTFELGGKADDYYSKFMTEGSMMYASINGELHIKNHDEISNMIKYKWLTDNIKVTSFTDNELSVEMNTELDGKSAGENSLIIHKSGDRWLLGDSYFLD